MAATAAHAGTVIDFDQFRDSETITNQIPGLTFDHAIVFTAGISLNERELPPHSSPNVASDNGGPLSITFADPVSFFSGYFTYAVPITLQLFAPDNRPMGTIHSRFGSNLALSGDPGSSPNELFELFSLLPVQIGRVTVTGSPRGGSFAMDDISFATAVPEPGSWALLLLGVPAFFLIRLKSKV